MVDADHGYGNALNVKRTVEELETAGVAGLTIEDTLLPLPYGAAGQTQLAAVRCWLCSAYCVLAFAADAIAFARRSRRSRSLLIQMRGLDLPSDVLR